MMATDRAERVVRRTAAKHAAITLAAATVLLGGASAAHAQAAEHTHAAHSHDSAGTSLSTRARAQVDSARTWMSRFDTPAKARAAGYRPVLGDVPLQGVHYVHRQRMLDASFAVTAPSMLMFSPVGDTMALVGAAYAYFVADSSADPEGFDGDADAWHGHPMFKLADRRLSMVHLWLTDAPDGPFAHDNAALAFVARGLTTPNDTVLDATARRQLGLALALAGDPGERLVRAARMGGPAVVAGLQAERDGINAVADSLDGALRGDDAERYRALASRATAHSDALLVHIRNAPPTAEMREAVGKLIDEFIGVHR